jgi:hypothetical protein
MHPSSQRPCQPSAAIDFQQFFFAFASFMLLLLVVPAGGILT